MCRFWSVSAVVFSFFQFYAVHMKLEVRRRDSLPTISGMMTQHIKRPCRSVGVQTTPTGEDNDIVRTNTCNGIHVVFFDFKEKNNAVHIK